MSLHIDFIYESEQRSASLVSLKFVVRLIGIVIPLLLLMFGLVVFFQYHQMKSELAGVEMHWKSIEPAYKDALELRAELESVRQIEAEFDRWRSVRLTWAKPLEAVRDAVPPTMQLTRLQAREDLKIDGTVPVYQFDLIMEGRARGISPRTDVEQFQHDLREHPDLVEIVDDVIIPPGSFQADPAPGAEREHRVFRLTAPFIARRFE